MCWPMRFSRRGVARAQAERPAVVNHGEASADETGDGSEAAADILAGICWRARQAALSRHLLAHAIGLLSLKSRHSADSTFLSSSSGRCKDLRANNAMTSV